MTRPGKIVGDLLSPLDFVVLVVPIDSAAPKGRLILPQQQVIRDVLESGATAIVCRDTELADTLKKLGQPPKLVITDSQAFASVSKDTPKNIPLTSFSILFSRYKGDLQTQIEGVKMLDKLKDGDTILMAEGCTHHRQCDDIGTVKLPRWISESHRLKNKLCHIKRRWISGKFESVPADCPLWRMHLKQAGNGISHR